MYIIQYNKSKANRDQSYVTCRKTVIVTDPSHEFCIICSIDGDAGETVNILRPNWPDQVRKYNFAALRLLQGQN